MYDPMITFRSLTAAQRGQQVLGSRGISAVLIRVPRALGPQGCGYGLRASAPAGQLGLILRLAGVPFSHIYRMTERGMEEVAV